MLNTGDSVPHFTVTNLEGAGISYGSIWQQRNLLLVMLPTNAEPEASASYASRLAGSTPAFNAHATACVVTGDRVEGLPRPGVVVADRWGEIVHVFAPPDLASLPSVGDLLEWVEYVQHQCPECQGEAK